MVYSACVIVINIPLILVLCRCSLLLYVTRGVESVNVITVNETVNNVDDCQVTQHAGGLGPDNRDTQDGHISPPTDRQTDGEMC